MTNGTIGQVTDTGNGRRLTIRYQDTEKRVVVPPDAPIVTYVSATRGDLVPGAKVIVNATRQRDGSLQATQSRSATCPRSRCCLVTRVDDLATDVDCMGGPPPRNSLMTAPSVSGRLD